MCLLFSTGSDRVCGIISSEGIAVWDEHNREWIFQKSGPSTTIIHNARICSHYAAMYALFWIFKIHQMTRHKGT